MAGTPRKDQSTMSNDDRQKEVLRLRFEARLAFLDGRNARARELNSRADAIARELRQCH